MPHLVKCPLCNGENFSLFLDQKDAIYFERRIVTCDDCGLMLVNPQPTEEELAAFYNGDFSVTGKRKLWNRKLKKYTYVETSPSTGQPNEHKLNHNPQEERVSKRISTLNRIKPPPAGILDIGCREGAFLKKAREKGYECRGVELSSRFAEIARDRAGVEVFCGTLEQFASGSCAGERFEIITLWDVIEHLTDPAATLSEINRLQENGGVLAVSTPNLASYRYYRYGHRWRGFQESQEHIVFFSPATLSNMLEKCGYEPIKVITRKISQQALRWLNLFRMGNVLEIYARKTSDK